MNTNARGVFNALAEGLVPRLLETPASIVNVGSMFSERDFKKGAPYAASKHAVIVLTKTAAIEAVPESTFVTGSCWNVDGGANA